MKEKPVFIIAIPFDLINENNLNFVFTKLFLEKEFGEKYDLHIYFRKGDGIKYHAFCEDFDEIKFKHFTHFGSTDIKNIQMIKRIG